MKDRRADQYRIEIKELEARNCGTKECRDEEGSIEKSLRKETSIVEHGECKES